MKVMSCISINVCNMHLFVHSWPVSNSADLNVWTQSTKRSLGLTLRASNTSSSFWTNVNTRIKDKSTISWLLISNYHVGAKCANLLAKKIYLITDNKLDLMSHRKWADWHSRLLNKQEVILIFFFWWGISQKRKCDSSSSLPLSKLQSIDAPWLTKLMTDFTSVHSGLV